MSVIAPFKKHVYVKVPNSSYIRTENKPAQEDAKPADQPAAPAQPETK